MELFEIIANFGVLGLVSAFAIEKFFAYLKGRKPLENFYVDDKQNVMMGRIDERLKAIETNHLPHIQKELEQNGKDHSQILVALAEIKVKLEEII